MHEIALFGAGKIGFAIAGLLGISNRYKTRVCDYDLSRAQRIASAWPNATAHELKLDDDAKTLALLDGVQAVVSALPFHCNTRLASLALRAKCHYFDLTEDVQTTKTIKQLAQGAPVCFMPQCGLAPGFISIAAAYLIRSFDTVESVKMRVGALPIYPSNRLKYNLTWSTEGLINEYGNMCELVKDGRMQLAYPLEGYERLSLNGAEYEAFNTSGGLGTLCETFEGKVHDLNYKSIRYPGHRDLIQFLMHDMQFNSDRDTLRQIFERSVSTTQQDKCIIFAEVRGQSENLYTQRTYASTIYHTSISGHHFGAIQVTTAAGVCAPLDILLAGKIGKQGGFVRCEEISLSDFLHNEFGKYYYDESALRDLNLTLPSANE